MASACNFKAPNGEQSDLGLILEHHYGSAEATKIMAVLQSEQALKIFDWVNNTQYNTPKEELSAPVAKALYDAVVEGKAFEPEKATDLPPAQAAETLEDILPELPVGLAGNVLDQEALRKSLKHLLPAVLTAEGKPTGELYNFTDFKEINDYVTGKLLVYLLPKIRGANGKVNVVSELVAGLNNAKSQLKVASNMFTAMAQGKPVKLPESHPLHRLTVTVTDPAEAAELAEKYSKALYSFQNIAYFTARSLKEYGVNIKPHTLRKISKLLKYDEKPDAQGAEERAELNEEFENYTVELDEGKSIQSFADNAINLDLHATASKNVKMFLAQLPAMEFFKPSRKNSPVSPKEQMRVDLGGRVMNQAMLNDSRIRTKMSSLHQPLLVNHKELLIKLYKVAQGIPEFKKQGVIDALRKSPDADLVHLGIALQSAPDQIINELFKVANNQYAVHIKVLYGTRDSKGKRQNSARNINSNKNNEIDTIVAEWRENQKVSPSIKMVNGQMTVSKRSADLRYKALIGHGEKLERLARERKEAALAYTQKFASLNPALQGNAAVIEKLMAPQIAASQAYQEEEQAAMKTILSFLDHLGITGITAEMIRDMDGTLESHLQLSNEKNPLGLFAKLATALRDSAGKDEIESATLLKNANPLYRETAALRELANLRARHSSELRFATNHKSITGETIQNFSLPSYASDTYKAIANGRHTLYSELMEHPFTSKAQWLLDQIRQGTTRLGYLEGLISADRNTEGTVRTEMSKREQFLTPLLMYHQNGKRADFIDMTKSDKTTTPVISNVEKFMVQAYGFHDSVIEQFENVFKAEFERIGHVTHKPVSDPKLLKGGQLFYYMPMFNKENMQKAFKEKRISAAEYNAIWAKDGKIQELYNPLLIRPMLVRMMGEVLHKETARWMNELRNFDGVRHLPSFWMDEVKKRQYQMVPVFGKTPKGKNFVSGYKQILKDKSEVHYTPQKANEMAAQTLVKQYVTQAFLMNVFSSMLVSGDPAIAYKPGKAKTVNGQINNTFKEYQKRQAKDIAPGAKPNFAPTDTFVSMVIKDPLTSSAMAAINPKYKEIDTIADAQEVTTVREQLEVMFKEGKIADQVYQGMLAVIDKGLQRPDKYYEFTEPEHLEVVLQAQKPVYVNRRFEDGSYTVDYVKSSAFALLPQFTAGTEMDKLRQKMEGRIGKNGRLEGHVNRAVFASGKKLGQPMRPIELFDNQGRIIAEALESEQFFNAQQTLTREGFKIQQEVPFKGEKEKISLVSQADRFITAGIQGLQGFALPGHAPMSGAELKRLRLETIRELSDMAMATFAEEVGGIEDIFDEDNELIDSHLRNPTKFFDRLLEEAEAKDYSPNELELLRTRTQSGKLMVPLWFSGSSKKLESMVMSLIGTITVPKIPGKSFVQASSIGIKRYATEIPQGAGIKFIKSFDPSKGLAFMSPNPGAQSSPAQVLVPFNFFAEDGSRLRLEDFLDENGQVDPDKLPDEVLQIVGMRIPNQGHNSMLPMQVVGFLPNTMGDLIIVPAEITTQMGSDFDVDKLYTYRGNYQYSEGRLSRYSGEDRGKQLQDQYYNIFWSVLTHPDMFSRVTNPLDQPDMIREKELAEGVTTEAVPNFFMPSAQIESYDAQKDAKRLVAFTALSGTFMSDIEDMTLYINEDAGIPYLPFKDANGKEIRLKWLSGTAKSLYIGANGEVEYRSKHDVNSALQNEVLDYAKNRTIDPLNINLKTYPAVDMLINLQSDEDESVGWSHIARITQQPIIKEYVSMFSTANDTFSERMVADQHGKIVKRLEDKYRQLAGLDREAEVELVAFSPEDLLKMIGDGEVNEQNAVDQLRILKMFAFLHSAGTMKMRAQGVFNRGPRGPGANFVEASVLRDKATELTRKDYAIEEERLISNMDNLMDGKRSQRGDDFHKTVGVAMRIGDDVMPYRHIRPLVRQLASMKGKETLSELEMNKVDNALKAYFFSSPQMGISKDVNGRLAELIYDTPHSLSLAKRVAEAKNTDWGKKNFFLSRLRTNIATDSAQPSTVTYLPIKTTVFEDEENIKAFIELLSGTETQQQLAQDLIDYNFLSGSTGGATSYNKFIPIAYIIGQGLDQKMRKIMNFSGWKGFTKNFIRQFVQHNPDFAPRLPASLKGTQNIINDPEAKDQVQERLTLLKPEEEDAFFDHYPEHFSVSGENGMLLYALQETTPYGGNYVRIDTLGKASFSEYNASDAYKRSIILANRASTKELAVKDFSFGVDQSLHQYSRRPKTEDSKDVFYSEFVEVGENSTSALDMIDKLSLEDSPLLKILSEATGQDAEVNSNLRQSPRIAEYRPKFNRIQLNMNRISTREQLIGALEHEYLHAVTARTLADIARLDHKAAVKKYGKATVDSYLNLEAVRQQLAEEHKGNDLMEYATSSIDELITHAFTNREVQRIMNETPVDLDVSLLDKFRNLIEEFLKAISEAMGLEINEGSALQAVIHDAATVIASNKKGQKSEFSEDSSLGSVYFDDDIQVHAVPEEIKTAIKDLQAHRRKLESMQFTQSALDENERNSFVLRNQEIDNLSADIDTLRKLGSFDLLATLGLRQVAWAKSILAQPNNSTVDLLSAWHTARTWSTLINNMYDGVDPSQLSDKIKSLQGDASAIEAQAIVQFKNTSSVDAKEFDPEQLSTNFLEAYNRDLGQMKSKVAQVLYEKVSEQKKWKNEELRKFNKEVLNMAGKLQKLATKRGVKYSELTDKLMQTGNEWGLVNQYSPALESFQDALEKNLNAKLSVAYNTPGLTTEQRFSLINAAKKEYKKKLESKMSYVNVAILLDHKTGELKSSQEAQFELKKLEREIGSEMVGKMVDRAQRNYKQYLDEKESYENVITATHENYLMQIPTIFEKELSALPAADRADYIAQKQQEAQTLMADKLRVWEGQNSPIVFYQMLSGLYVKGLAGQFRAYSRLVTAPKLTSTEFFDPKYEALMNDPELLEAYNFIQDNLSKYVQMLPVSVQDQLEDSFLPIIEVADKTITTGNALGLLGQHIEEALLAKESMLERIQGERRAIPLKYIKSSHLEVDQLERDPMVLLSKFAEMALHFNGMSQVQAYAELAQQAVIQATRKTSEGRFAVFNTGAEQTAKMLQHYLDVEMYQKQRKQEAIFKSDVYSINPVTDRRIKRQIAENDQQMQELADDYKAGRVSIAHFASRRAELMSQLGELTKNRAHFTGSNLADVAIKITQLKALSWNPMSAMANLTFGIVSLSIHANARTDFDSTTMRKALTTMFQATRNALGSSNPTARKILALMDRTNLMGELLDADSPGESKVVTRGKERWKKVISPYQMLRQSDYFMKGSIAVAMAKHQMIEVERNGQKVQMSLWDAMDEEGKIEGAPEWYNHEDSRVETQFQAFRNRAVGVSKVIMGNQDANSPLMVKRSFLGRLITQFRVSWLAEGVAQRFESEKFNQQLGRTVKGRYQTYGDLGFIASAKMLALQVIGARTAFIHKGEELSEVDRENMRKNLAELIWYTTVMGMMLSLKALAGDDDDKEAKGYKALMFTLNLIIRTRDDLSFYASPTSTTDTLSNIIPASKVLTDFLAAVDGTRRIIFDEPDSRFTGEHFRNRWLKTLPPLSLIPKMERQMSKF